MKVRLVEAELFHAEEEGSDLTELIVAFRNFAKTTKQQTSLFYIRSQCLPRSKQSPLRLHKISVWMSCKARELFFSETYTKPTTAV
jgi:hypothetical protein